MKNYTLPLSTYSDLKKMSYEDMAKWAADLFAKGVKAGKAAKWEATVAAVSSVCDTIDDCIGLHAYEYTDRIRKMYKIPTKYGY